MTASVRSSRATRHLAFVRSEVGHCARICIIAFETDAGDLAQRDQQLDRIKTAVNRWVRESDTGARAWEETCEDFNVGDLLLNTNDEDLIRALEVCGIYNLRCEAEADSSETVDYDLVLNHR